MRAHHFGSGFRVRASETDVAAFAASWPCFGPASALTFDFDSKGDLVDVAGELSAQDGSGLAALADDARLVGAYALGLADVLDLHVPALAATLRQRGAV